MREGWVTEKLMQLGEIQTGTTPSTRNKEFYGDFIPFIKPPHFNVDGSIEYENSGLSKKGLEKGRLIKENSILMVCIGATIGKTGMNIIPVSCNQQINAFTPNPNLCPKFFYYLLSSSVFFDKVIRNSSQATLPMINKTKWQNLEVSYPESIEEQKQIVALLDKAFAAIDQAKANIEKNIENAKELFQSKLNDIFSQKGDGWEEKTLGKLGKVSMCKRILKKQTTPDGEIPFYKMGTFGKEPNAFISKEIYDDFRSKYSFPKKGDILLSASGTIGRRVIYDGEPAYFQDSNIVWIDNNEELVTNEYLYQFYGVCDFNPSKGATISRLYNDDLRKIKISFPSIKEQKVIIPNMIELSNQTLQIESNYKKKLTNLENLKKAILQKAFSGALSSPKGTKYEKEVHNDSEKNKNPERAI